MSRDKYSSTSNTRKYGLRELTQVEYQFLWPDLYRNPLAFEDHLREHNAAAPEVDRIPFYSTKRGVLVMRESLPVAVQMRLDEYEKTRSAPFVRGFKLIHGGKR